MEEDRWIKFIAVPGLFLTTLVTSLLLGFDRSHWSNAGSFYEAVTNNRATTQLFVQIISNCLGALQIRIICSLFNFYTRLRLSQRPVALDLLKFWNSVSGIRLDWSLPTRTFIPLVAFLLVSLVPGAIWAGALTPVPIPTSTPTTLYGFHHSSPDISVPRYGMKSNYLWGPLDFLEGGLAVRNEKGTFTYAPNYELQGTILNQAASASSSNESTPRHAKIDNSQYVYEGRSFGVGSSVGLVDSFISKPNAIGYSYNEIGYQAQVHCIKNDTIDWAISDVKVNPQDGSLPNIYLVSGTLSNGAGNRYAACGFENSKKIVALVGQAMNGKNIFAIAAGSDYKELNQTQCTVDFKPTNFSIKVNTTARVIAVTPLASKRSVVDMDGSGNMTAITMRMPTSFSQQNACNLYTSIIGNTFNYNIKNVVSAHGTNSHDPMYHDVLGQVLMGVEDSLTSMLDNVLLAYSSAQLMIANDTIASPTTIITQAVRIGAPAYIYIIAAINFAILLLYLIELARTRGWKGLQRFDYTDIKSVIVGTSMGGSSVANATRQAHDLKQSRWDGSSGDRVVGKIAVHLDNTGDDLALVHVSKTNGIRDSKHTDYEMLAHAEEASTNEDMASRKRSSFTTSSI
ncbi:MAG: hypothetical protein M1812_004504 [Candelaria pacifica]|nr:MAG: hypothetical protein M1812_004504 [Candelaria pacifica]